MRLILIWGRRRIGPWFGADFQVIFHDVLLSRIKLQNPVISCISLSTTFIWNRNITLLVGHSRLHG